MKRSLLQDLCLLLCLLLVCSLGGCGKKWAEPEPEGLDCPCRDRALLMGTLSELFLDLGADYGNGLSLRAPGFALRIRPSAARAAVRVAVDAADQEFARSLAISAQELIQALDL